MALVSCGANQDKFYVDPLDLTLSMEYLNDDIYRLHLIKEDSDSINNYIDFRYELCEMPCMNLYFPYGKLDTIYIQEENGNIVSYQCDNYHIKMVEPMRRDSVPKKGLSLTYDKNYRYFYMTDYTLAEIPCVNVLIEPFFLGTVVSDKINGIRYQMKDGVKEIYHLNAADKSRIK